MKKTDNTLNIITASTFKGIGRAWIIKNFQEKRTEDDIIELLNYKNNCVTKYEFTERKQNIRNQLNSIYKEIDGFNTTAIGDDDFPKYSGGVKASEQPIVLFYKGNLDILQINNSKISVIGVLNPSEDIEKREREIVKYLVKNNFTIVSGLANGCDSIAHQETIINDGKTIAILPSPLNNVLPKSNTKLANEILKNGGLLITEYYTNISSRYELSARYIERDRLQALYCDCVLLTASYSPNDVGNDSGSRHAMSKAKEYSIKRAVMYNENTDINNSMFDLNRQYIKQDNFTTIVDDKNLDTINILLEQIIKDKEVNFLPSLF